MTPLNSREDWIDDLSPVTKADWNYDLAGHLLERAGFGGTPAEIRRLASMSPDDAVVHLVRHEAFDDSSAVPFEETNFYPANFTWRDLATAFAAIENLPIPGLGALPDDHDISDKVPSRFDDLRMGITPNMRRVAASRSQAVVDAFFFYTFMDRLESYRLQKWIGDCALKTGQPLQEKLALFWHCYFAVGNEKVKDYRKMKARYDRFRSCGNGKFREILRWAVRDPALLIYLDNYLNVKGRPNENFARELMELFTLGWGKFTEYDVKQVARAFTGWGLDHFSAKFIEHNDLHDAAAQTVFGHTGTFTGDDIIDIILQQRSCAEFVSAKIYNYFVRDEMADDCKRELSQLLYSSDYDISLFLTKIFLSRDFYSVRSLGTQIKSPFHLMISTYKKLGMKTTAESPDFARSTARLGQDLFFPPSVKGWEGGAAWITPATLIHRGTILRFVLFPEEAPAITDSQLDGSRRHSGEAIHQFFLELARNNNFTDFPPPDPNSDCSALRADGDAPARIDEGPTNVADHNLSRGIFNGAWRSRLSQKIPLQGSQRISLVKLLREDAVTNVEEVIHAFGRRFLRTSLTTLQHDCLVTFLERQLESTQLDLERPETERAILELLSVIFSMPEYQLC